MAFKLLLKSSNKTKIEAASQASNKPNFYTVVRRALFYRLIKP